MKPSLRQVALTSTAMMLAMHYHWGWNWEYGCFDWDKRKVSGQRFNYRPRR